MFDVKICSQIFFDFPQNTRRHEYMQKMPPKGLDLLCFLKSERSKILKYLCVLQKIS